MRRLLVLCSLAALAGCVPTGGTSSGGLEQAAAKADAPFAILDLNTRAIAYATALPDLASNPQYRDGKMVFRRVGPDGRRALVGVFEVTQAQWQRLDGTTPWTAVDSAVIAAAPAADMPAYNLDYDAVVGALAAFTLDDGARLAVPSAQQWGDAAGAAQGYAWGAQPTRSALAAYAVVAESVVTEANKTTRLVGGIDTGGPAPVGSRQPTTTGVYDIHGNVWEWNAPGTIVRGGSWYDAVSLARVEVTGGAGQGLAADVDHALIGVRLVLLP